MSLYYLDYDPTKPKATGVLAVRYVCNLWSEPSQIEQWWPIGGYRVDPYRCAGKTIAELIGQPMRDIGNAIFECDKITFWLANGTKTTPVHSVTTPIPQPKTKASIKYESGRWQKYLKTKGWVSA